MCVCKCVCVIWGAAVLPATYTPTPMKHHIHANTSKPAHLPTTPKDATPRLPTPQHNTTLLVHRAPQLIADPAPNPLLVHHITQSHVQITHGVHAPQTGRNGASEIIAIEQPDATAREHQWWYCGILR